jgi:hypothetical protein
VILEHSVLGLHTCLVPVFLSFPLLLCIPCLGSALQYTPPRLLSAFIHLVCITSTSIPASLRCTCFDIAWQISRSLSTFRANPTTVQVGHYGQPTVTAVELNLQQYHHRFHTQPIVFWNQESQLCSPYVQVCVDKRVRPNFLEEQCI